MRTFADYLHVPRTAALHYLISARTLRDNGVWLCVLVLLLPVPRATAFQFRLIARSV